MKLEILLGNQLDKVEPIYKMMGGEINPRAIIAVIKDGEEVVGMAAVEEVLHLGPIWVKEDHRGKGLADLLIKKLESVLRKGSLGYYTFPSNDSCRKVFDKLGLVKTDWSVYKREF